MATEKQKTRIVEALLALAAEKDFSAIGLAEIAERAELDLAELRKAYDGRIAILAEFVRRIDAAVLAGDDPAMKTEPVRDRLFDAIMRRFDALTPYRAGVKGLIRAARRDPVLAAEMNKLALISQSWTLAAAGLETGGLKGLARAQALALAYVRVLEVFLEEEDPQLPKTMAALDKALKRLEGLAERARKVEGLLAPLTRVACGLASRRGRSRRDAEPTPSPAPGGEATATGAV